MLKIEELVGFAHGLTRSHNRGFRLFIAAHNLRRCFRLTRSYLRLQTLRRVLRRQLYRAVLHRQLCRSVAFFVGNFGSQSRSSESGIKDFRFLVLKELGEFGFRLLRLK
ncbi:hypothetical protein Salat_1468700 [Sesamum alatum]|uniref:Uncharacterized protein n=1 Tax=Sesamum alatum TaxID=300844 RepID=A0AAE1YBB6_9LAMI|nr:hypothetical protein Salat_1468700 [Sesamum alatum]